MRTRRAARSSLLGGLVGGAAATVAVLAGCGSVTAPAASPSSGTSAAASSGSGTPGTASSPASPGAAPTGACATAPAPASGALTGLEFVSPAVGWAVGQHVILGTTDGGRHWTVQDRGRLDLQSADFISGQNGWVVGTRTVLATSDGGVRWNALPDPCIRSVHFVSASDGFAIAGGSNFGDLAAPSSGGDVLATTNGGQTWHTLAAPKDPQTVCFNTVSQGWLGAAGQLYQTADGGRTWTAATAAPRGLNPGYVATMVVDCAGDGSAWAVDVGPGAASNQEPQVGYHADLSGAVPLFAEQYFPHPGVHVTAQAPGSYTGPVSAVSPGTAAYVGWCPACGADGSVPWDLVTGTQLARRSAVTGLTQPEGASFLSGQTGWVAGADGSQQRIVFTSDGGRSWQVQYSG